MNDCRDNKVNLNSISMDVGVSADSKFINLVHTLNVYCDDATFDMFYNTRLNGFNVFLVCLPVVCVSADRRILAVIHLMLKNILTITLHGKAAKEIMFIY